MWNVFSPPTHKVHYMYTYNYIIQVSCDGGEKKTVSDDQDIYSAKQKLPKGVLKKIKVSCLVRITVYSSSSDNYCTFSLFLQNPVKSC